MDRLPLPPPVAVQVEWTACRVRMPDDDRSVQMYLPGDEEHPVVLGWWDGARGAWRNFGADILAADAVTWWAETTPPPHEPESEAAAGLRWAVHVPGPDDMVPARSRAEAEAACVLVNAAAARLPAIGAVHAAPIAWPYSETAHAQQLGEFALLVGGVLLDEATEQQGPQE